jgi:hypothetical protein
VVSPVSSTNKTDRHDMTETGTMSAKGSIVTDCDSLLYTGVTKEVFFTRFKNIKLTDSFWKVFRFMF